MTHAITFRPSGGSSQKSKAATPVLPAKSADVKRFLRSHAEIVLLQWVICWMLLATVATVVMCVLLLKANSYPVLDAESALTLGLHEKLIREKYSTSDNISKTIITSITNDSLYEIVKSLSQITGSEYERQVALSSLINERMTSYGLDYTTMVSYNVLKSRPDPEKENQVQLYKNDVVAMTAATKGVPAAKTEMARGHAYNAYAAAGDVKEPIVYVNYGRLSDFNYLRTKGISVQGKVCIARLGQISRANKVKHAEKEGAAAIVLFPDPASVGPTTNGERPFPDSSWVGGSVAYVHGDPLTPGYPSRDGMPRLSIDSAELPRIPCQPIGHDDARTILGELTDEKCPDDWVPQLGVTCNIIGSDSVKLRVEVNNILQESTVTNIIGIINGTIERDRLVIVGNHLDAHGAADHSLGIAQLLEEARVFGSLHKDGWRPRRTLVFSLWDGNEDGMLGSTEWVEDHMFRLQARAVIYIGTELLSGENFFPRASPTITNSIRLVSSLIPHYKKSTDTLLAIWSSQPGVPRGSHDMPMSLPVIGRSDDAPFVFGGGVPTASISFAHNYNGTAAGYDAFQMVAKFPDPGLHVSRMSAQLVASLARMWADRKMLPYGIHELAFTLRAGLDDFTARHETAIKNNKLDLSAPKKAAAEFAMTAKRFAKWTKSIDRRNPIMTRIANDNMMRIEKIFIMPGGIPTRPITMRNLVYSPEGQLFPGLEDAINQNPLDRQAFGLQTALLADILCQAKDYLMVTPA